jgi:hypothetical protein
VIYLCAAANSVAESHKKTSLQEVETTQTAADPQVKAVLAKMAAAGVLHPTTVEQVRQAYVFLSHAFR